MLMTGQHEDTHNVLIVAANKWAYDSYTNYSAYVCQPGRYFRPGVVRLGFFKDNVIQREFPEILARRGHVSITEEAAANLRSSGDPEDARFAKVVKNLIADGEIAPSYQIFLLSGPEDSRTLRIPHLIRNTKRGKSGHPVAWTQKHGYVSEAALRRNPETTTELDEWTAGMNPKDD
jgi:hypothetical protein